MSFVRVLMFACLAAAAPVAAQAEPIFMTAPPSLQGLEPSSRLVPDPQTTSALTRAPAPAPQFQAPAPAPAAAPAAAVPAFVPAAAPPPLVAPAPSLPASVVPAASEEPQVPLPDTDARHGGIIRHLTNNIQGFRLSGEIAASEWPIYITRAQARLHLRFQVGYIAAVSVMPEASYLTLMINDVIVGRTNIHSVSDVRKVTFDIPDGLLKPGFNSVRLMAEERHRVDCSLRATYELWTQIDPSQTGLVLPRGDVGVNNLGDLAALPPDAQGALPIRVVIPAKTTLSSIERVMRAVSLISLTGRFEQPTVDVGPMADGEYGINLAIGTAAEVREETGLNIGPVLGPRVAIVPAAPGRRTTVIVTGLTDEQVNQALNQFSVSEKSGTPAGLRAAAAFPGYRLEGGQTVRLRDLGVPSIEFSGRLFRVAFNVIMPSDFYAADYDRVMLDLAGGYAPNLTSDAQIVVAVNGRNATSLKLAKASGDVFSNNEIPLPLGYMRPGLNRIEIEAHVPTASDKACDPLAALHGRKRFLLLDSTAISVPRIARIARMPDLAVTATGGFPYAGGKKRPVIYVPSPDRESIGAAASIAAHLSISAGAPIDFAVTTIPPKKPAATLVVGPATAIDKSILNAVGIPVKDLVSAWSKKFNPKKTQTDPHLSRYEEEARNRLVLQRNFPAACHIGRPPNGFGRFAARYDRMATGTIPDDGSDHALFEEWDANVRNHNRLRQIAVGTYLAVRNWSRSKFFDATNWFQDRFQTAAEGPLLTSKASLVVAQNLIASDRDSVWTVVTAPNSDMLAESVECLVDPRVWRQVAGRMAVLDASEGAVRDAPVVNSKLIPTQPLSIVNLRLIAAAWLSLNGSVFVFLALALALVLAFASHWFISNVGRKSE